MLGSGFGSLNAAKPVATAADSRSAEPLAASRLSQRSGQTAPQASGSGAALCKDAGSPSLQSPAPSEAKAQRVENGQVAAQHSEFDLQEEEINSDGSTIS